MGLFSKEECVFCGEKAGMLGRKKMKGGDYVCKDCEHNCSLYFDPGIYTKEEVEAHIEYMKKQDKLYNEEFATLGDESKYEFKHLFGGIVLADSIAMFEIIDPKTKKRNYKELFRYDQIRSYDRYSVLNNDSDSNDLYSEVGIEFKMYCSFGVNGAGMSDSVLQRAHPYLESFRIVCGKDVSDLRYNTNHLMNKLNEIFGREPDTISIGEGIKESIFGSKKEREDMKQGIEMFKSLGKLAKAKIDKDEDAIADAKEGLTGITADTIDRQFGFQQKHKELADAAEQRVWK